MKKNAKGNSGEKNSIKPPPPIYNNNTRMEMIYAIAHLLYVCTM